MKSPKIVRQAFALRAAGVTHRKIAADLGIGMSTLDRWLRLGEEATISPHRLNGTGALCPAQCPRKVDLDEPSDAYLLGQYLGDGWIGEGRRGVFRLYIYCCAAYPHILEECATAMQAVVPGGAVTRQSARAVGPAVRVPALPVHERVGRHPLAVLRRMRRAGHRVAAYERPQHLDRPTQQRRVARPVRRTEVVSARGGTRTRTPFRTEDFEASASAIPPPGQVELPDYRKRRAHTLASRGSQIFLARSLIRFRANTVRNMTVAGTNTRCGILRRSSLPA